MTTDANRYIVDESGEKKEVVLSIEEYNALKEDLSDLAKVAERREEDTTSHEKLKEKLRDNGLL